CDQRQRHAFGNRDRVMRIAPIREQIIPSGLGVAARHGWQQTATAHLARYHTLLEPDHA
ncbi:MSMEG_0565 family glycosyltransferase, partial [Rhizobium ruizarguesonis]